jgi:hypothetical protein
MKVLARDDRLRPADADDLLALARVASSDDWTSAHAAASLVTERGFGRGRDVVRTIEALSAGRSPFDLQPETGEG